MTSHHGLAVKWRDALYQLRVDWFGGQNRNKQITGVVELFAIIIHDSRYEMIVSGTNQIPSERKARTHAIHGMLTGF